MNLDAAKPMAANGFFNQLSNPPAVTLGVDPRKRNQPAIVLFHQRGQFPVRALRIMGKNGEHNCFLNSHPL